MNTIRGMFNPRIKPKALLASHSKFLNDLFFDKQYNFSLITSAEAPLALDYGRFCKDVSKHVFDQFMLFHAGNVFFLDEDENIITDLILNTTAELPKFINNDLSAELNIGLYHSRLLNKHSTGVLSPKTLTQLSFSSCQDPQIASTILQHTPLESLLNYYQKHPEKVLLQVIFERLLHHNEPLIEMGGKTKLLKQMHEILQSYDVCVETPHRQQSVEYPIVSASAAPPNEIEEEFSPLNLSIMDEISDILSTFYGNSKVKPVFEIQQQRVGTLQIITICLVKNKMNFLNDKKFTAKADDIVNAITSVLSRSPYNIGDDKIAYDNGELTIKYRQNAKINLGHSMFTLFQSQEFIAAKPKFEEKKRFSCAMQ